MSQAPIWGMQTVGPATASDVTQRGNEMFDAVLSSHRGAARPTYAVAGSFWVRPVSGTVEELYLFDGVSDILIGTYNPTTHSYLSAADAVVDRAYAEYTANTDLAAVFPVSDTVPNNTLGTEILSLTITPKSLTNRMRLRFQGAGSTNTNSAAISVALFRDAVAPALAASLVSVSNSGYMQNLTLEFEHVPAAIVPVTYRLRVGPSTGAIMRLNGTTLGRFYGGAMRATLVAQELRG